MARVVIVGGGVIGCAIAERLSRDSRHRVLLLERDALGAHASSAAAGILSPHGEADMIDFDLANRSLALFPETVRRVERSGIAVEFREQESLVLAVTEEEERGLRQAFGLPRASSFPPAPDRWLDADQVRAAEPALSPRVRGAALFAEAQVTPIRLVLAMARTAAAQGAEIKEGTPVRSVTVRDGCAQGVETAEGLVGADFVVLSAGPWSAALVAPLGIALEVRPSRGQLVSLRPGSGLLHHTLLHRGSYLVSKPDGAVVAGTTKEDVGFDDRPTVEGLARLLEFATCAVPGLRSAVVERVWAALRPATPNGRPIIGPAPAVPNLVLATGHSRNGILLAPITAELVAERLP